MRLSRWPLANKLILVASAFMALALGSIALTLWVTWQLEGGAAAVNEAGRMRMQSYRLVLALAPDTLPATRAQAAAAMDASLELLRTGAPARPLFVPWNEETRAQFIEVRREWQLLRVHWERGLAAPSLAEVDRFVAQVDGFVSEIERQLSDWTAMLRYVQFALVALTIASTLAFIYVGHVFVLEPLRKLHAAVRRLQADDFSARVEVPSGDEFGHLAEGFNTMASHLQALYGQLEAKVAEKTERLEVKRERLAALYDVSSFIAQADDLNALGEGFARLVRRIARADAVAVRWSGEGNERYLMLASDGLPAALSEAEQCLPTAHCHCGQTAAQASTRVIPIANADGAAGHCSRLGFRMLLSVPVAIQGRVIGEIDLFFRTPREVSAEERSLYDALATHLASGMEGLRANALEREQAVAQERTLIAQELHDSIAQSLAFLKIQVALLKEAMRQHDEQRMAGVVGEIEAGVRESNADVRELLMHFRTRTQGEDVLAALRVTLQKFEHQSGVHAQLRSFGHGVPLPADAQIQVLHIVQEALSNVRKHARASSVTLTVHQTPAWSFEVQDDGIGFEPQAERDDVHLGLRIMRERAQRIGAALDWVSQPGGGATVTLTLPQREAAEALAA